jgi:hypothetical protein
LKCRSAMGMETNVACIKHTSFFDLLLHYFQSNFLEQLACCGQEDNRIYILKKCWFLTGFW